MTTVTAAHATAMAILELQKGRLGRATIAGIRRSLILPGCRLQPVPVSAEAETPRGSLRIRERPQNQHCQKQHWQQQRNRTEFFKQHRARRSRQTRTIRRYSSADITRRPATGRYRFVAPKLRQFQPQIGHHTGEMRCSHHRARDVCDGRILQSHRHARPMPATSHHQQGAISSAMS